MRGGKDDGGAAEPRKLRAGWAGRKQGHFVGRTWGGAVWEWGGQLLAEGRGSTTIRGKNKFPLSRTLCDILEVVGDLLQLFSL